MKRILLPTDFSDNAYNAIRYAVQFFQNEICTFYLLNTFTPLSYTAEYLIENPVPYGLEDVAIINSQRAMENTEKKIKKELLNSQHHFVKLSAFNTLVSEIKDVIEKYTIDFIIMGTKGATGAKEVFIGSNTQKVLRNIDHCPILLIPDNCCYQKISKIAFATNFERLYYKSEILPIRNLARLHKAEIQMIHAYDEPKRTEIQNHNFSSLEQYFEETSYDVQTIEDFSTIEKAIQTFIKELKIDLLVMINYKHSFIKRLIREAVIKKMTFHTSVPFLIIPADT